MAGKFKAFAGSQSNTIPPARQTGRIRVASPSVAKDKVVGLWFKAFDAGGKLIGEYINPTSVATKQKWKE